MAATKLEPAMTVDEYLSTVFRPDRDFVDEHLEERNSRSSRNCRSL